MKIVLAPGDKLEIEFDGTDGSLAIDFAAADKDRAGHILVVADLPDSIGRSGEIYKEVFGGNEFEEPIVVAD